MGAADDEVERTRKLAASRAWTTERVIRDVESLDLHDAALVESLRAKKQALVPALRSFARSASGRARARAALLLLYLGELSATKTLAEILTDGDGALVRTTLASMSMIPARIADEELPLSQRVPVDGSVLWPVLARLIESDDDAIALMATSIAARTFGMPDTLRPTMHALLRDPRPQLRDVAIGWLARRGDPLGLAAIDAVLLGPGNEGAEAHWCLLALADYAAAKDPVIRDKARAVAARFIESRLSSPTGYVVDNDVSNAMRAMQGFVAERAALEGIIGSPRANWVRGAAIRRQASLEREAALPKLEARLRGETDPVILTNVAEATASLLESTPALPPEARDSLRQALESVIVRVTDPEASRALLGALVALGGDLGPTLEVLEARAEGWARTRLLWLRRRIGVKRACAALAGEGIIPDPAADDVDRLAKVLKREGPSSLVFDRLFDAGRMHVFDTEARSVPPDYVDLLTSLGKLARGFPIESPSQDAEPAGIVVRFIAGRRLFRFHPRDRGDWFDVGSVIAALDRALEIAGRTERYFLLHSEGQSCVVVCAPAEPFRRVAEHLAIPLEPDADAAVRAGIAYEAAVVGRTRDV